MVHACFGARRGSARRGGWLAASAAAHGAVIAALVSSPPSPGSPIRTRQAPTERIAYVTPTAHLDFPVMVPHAPPAIRRSARHDRRVGRTTTTEPPRLSLASLDRALASMTPIALPDSLPTRDPSPDPVAVASSGIDFGGIANRFLEAVMGRAYAIANPNAIYDEAAVDKIAEAMRENPKPIYPFSLRSAGIEDSFIVRFVVDTTGRVDEGSLEFPHEAQRLLVASVRHALMRSRYFPAVLGGQPVRQLVAQRFSFVLTR